MDIALWLDACKLVSVEYSFLPGGVFFAKLNASRQELIIKATDDSRRSHLFVQGKFTCRFQIANVLGETFTMKSAKNWVIKLSKKLQEERFRIISLWQFPLIIY